MLTYILDESMHRLWPWVSLSSPQTGERHSAKCMLGVGLHVEQRPSKPRTRELTLLGPPPDAQCAFRSGITAYLDESVGYPITVSLSNSVRTFMGTGIVSYARGCQPATQPFISLMHSAYWRPGPTQPQPLHMTPLPPRWRNWCQRMQACGGSAASSGRNPVWLTSGSSCAGW